MEPVTPGEEHHWIQCQCRLCSPDPAYRCQVRIRDVMFAFRAALSGDWRPRCEDCAPPLDPSYFGTEETRTLNPSRSRSRSRGRGVGEATETGSTWRPEETRTRSRSRSRNLCGICHTAGPAQQQEAKFANDTQERGGQRQRSFRFPSQGSVDTPDQASPAARRSSALQRADLAHAETLRVLGKIRADRDKRERATKKKTKRVVAQLEAAVAEAHLREQCAEARARAAAKLMHTAIEVHAEAEQEAVDCHAQVEIFAGEPAQARKIARALPRWEPTEDEASLSGPNEEAAVAEAHVREQCAEAGSETEGCADPHDDPLYDPNTGIFRGLPAGYMAIRHGRGGEGRSSAEAHVRKQCAEAGARATATVMHAALKVHAEAEQEVVDCQAQIEIFDGSLAQARKTAPALAR